MSKLYILRVVFKNTKFYQVGLQIEGPGICARQPIVMPNLPKPLTLEEKKFLLAVERGDAANVRRFVSSNCIPQAKGFTLYRNNHNSGITVAFTMFIVNKIHSAYTLF